MKPATFSLSFTVCVIESHTDTVFSCHSFWAFLLITTDCVSTQELEMQIYYGV